MNSLPHCATTARFIPQSITAEVCEGDWAAYQRHSSSRSKDDFVGCDGGMNAFRRQCALAYMGNRAQLFGGVCNKMLNRTFTPRFIAELGETNEHRRFARYPWLERLLHLMAEIEGVQAASNDPGNVIPITSVTK